MKKSPGAVRTNIYEGAEAGSEKGLAQFINEACAKKYPVGRQGTPEDIGNAILFLASEEASFITGTNMLVDGGHIAANVNIL